MLVAMFASGLFLRVANADDLMAKVEAAKNAYGRCAWEEAKARYSGTDTTELERSVMDACRSQLTAWEDSMVSGASPAAQSAAHSALEATVPSLIKITVAGVASCKKNEARASASDRALCEHGGY
jgi:hypothetical protein